MSGMRIGSWLGVLCLLSGCASFDYRYTRAEEQHLIAQVLGDSPARAQIAPLHLSAAAKRRLDERIKYRWGDHRKLEQLRNFMFDKNEMHITYSADHTKTAMQVWSTRTGNCLSMTNLFIAAARHVGLDAHYETVRVRPTWDAQGATMVRYEHIIAVGKLRGGEEYAVDFLPEFVVGDRRSMQITDSQAKALYYNNLGAEAVIAGHLQQAIGYIRQALRIDGEMSDGWNNMGAALRRAGEMNLAEFAYQRAVHLDSDNYSALSNLAQFYRSEGKLREAQYFQARIAAYHRRNPYYHYFVAHRYFEKGEYVNAIRWLDQAVSLKRNEPEFYLALARTYAKLGNDHERHRYEALAAVYRKKQQSEARNARNQHFWIKNPQ